MMQDKGPNDLEAIINKLEKYLTSFLPRIKSYDY